MSTKKKTKTHAADTTTPTPVPAPPAVTMPPVEPSPSPVHDPILPPPTTEEDEEDRRAGELRAKVRAETAARRAESEARKNASDAYVDPESALGKELVETAMAMGMDPKDVIMNQVQIRRKQALVELAAKKKAEREEARELKRQAKAASIPADKTTPRAARPQQKTARPAHQNTEDPTATPADKATPKAERTMAHLAERWAAGLQRAGKTATTVAGYKAEIQKAVEHFGADSHVTDLTARQIQNYNESDRVTKTRAGKAAAKPGIDKTRRALRLALDWAVLAGWIDANPADPKNESKAA